MVVVYGILTPGERFLTIWNVRLFINTSGTPRGGAVAGVLTVIRTLDRETASEYQLNISATDHGVPSLSSVTSLTIRVFDVNDNPPVFVISEYNATVLENQPSGTFVTVVSATDFDDPTSTSVCDSAVHECF